MSKSVKAVARIALPIALSFAAPGLGSAIGGSILGAGAAGSATLGNALLGAATGALSGGGVKGALLGAAAGGLAPNLGDIASNVIGGTQVGDFLGVQAPNLNSGYSPGEITSRSLGATNAPAGLVADTTGGVRSLGTVGTVLQAGNALATLNSANAAEEAARIQAEAVDKAVQTQAPYNALGTSAAQQIQQIQADPGAYVQNNPFYKGLADEAQQRLLANEAAKGKLASGGTQDALQTSLLNLGNGLVQQQVGTLQNQVNSGQNAASTVSGLQTDRGAVQAGGVVGSATALNTGYQNQINTLLALQNLNKTPSYSPVSTLRR